VCRISVVQLQILTEFSDICRYVHAREINFLIRTGNGGQFADAYVRKVNLLIRTGKGGQFADTYV
jgi:hypothetical protein